MLDRLIESGMDAARLNFSHGDYDTHAAAIAAIRADFTHYTPVAGIPDLIDAVREKFARDNGLTFDASPNGAPILPPKYAASVRM